MPKLLEIDQNNMCMKCLTLNVDLNGPSRKPLCSRMPAHVSYRNLSDIYDFALTYL